MRTTKIQTDDDKGNVASESGYSTRKVSVSLWYDSLVGDRQKVEKHLRGSVCCLLSCLNMLACRIGGCQRQGQSRQ